MNRRLFLSTAAGGLAGAALTAGFSGSADAAVRLEQLTVNGGDHAIRGDVASVVVSGEVGYSFDVPDSEPTPELFQVSLHVGPEDARIGSAGGRASSRSASGTLEISADLLDADAYAASDFEPGDSPVSVEVPALVKLEVVGNNQTLATASQRDTAEITVSQAGYDASLHGSVGGELSVDVRTETE